jgi:hypothetical protein
VVSPIHENMKLIKARKYQVIIRTKACCINCCAMYTI